MKERKPIKLITVTILSDGKQIMSQVTRANGMEDSLVITLMEEWLNSFKSKNGKAS